MFKPKQYDYDRSTADTHQYSDFQVTLLELFQEEEMKHYLDEGNIAKMRATWEDFLESYHNKYLEQPPYDKIYKTIEEVEADFAIFEEKTGKKPPNDKKEAIVKAIVPLLENNEEAARSFLTLDHFDDLKEEYMLAISDKYEPTHKPYDRKQLEGMHQELKNVLVENGINSSKASVMLKGFEKLVHVACKQLTGKDGVGGLGY